MANINENVINLTEDDDHMDRLVKCLECAHIFLGEQRLMNHMETVHKEEDQSNDVETSENDSINDSTEPEKEKVVEPENLVTSKKWKRGRPPVRRH